MKSTLVSIEPMREPFLTVRRDLMAHRLKLLYVPISIDRTTGKLQKYVQILMTTNIRPQNSRTTCLIFIEYSFFPHVQVNMFHKFEVFCAS